MVSEQALIHALELATAKAEGTMEQALLDQANALELKKKNTVEYPKTWFVSCACVRNTRWCLCFGL